MGSVLRRVRLLSTFLVATMMLSIIAVTKVRDDAIRPSNSSSISSTDTLIFSTPLMVGIGFVRDSNSLNQSTRIEIYNYIRDNPGIHLRGICSGLGLSIGVVQYHLQSLTRAGRLSSRRYRRYKRYFEAGRFDENAMKILSFLRHGTVRRILSMLSEGQTFLHKDLASKLGISSQALTWQINRLERVGLIDCVTEGTKTRYLLAEESAAMVRMYLSKVS